MANGSEHEAGPATPLPQHPPGPWHYDPEFGEIVSFVERPFPELSGRYIVAETVELSNGPLIAAAPDLLAFVAKVAKQLCNDPIRAERELAYEALLLIAKAEGRAEQ